MKNIIVAIILSLIFSCNAQNTKIMRPTVDNKFEKFEEVNFEKIIDNNKFIIRGYLPNGNYVEIIQNEDTKGYLETIKDTYFQISKSFYKNTNSIKRKGIGFNGDGFAMGTWYFFDEAGKLIKEENYDEPFKFTFDDILKFCKKEEIRVDKGPILQSTGFHTDIFRNVVDGQPWWKIRRLKNHDTIETIKLDGITGKVLSRQESHYINN